MPEDAVIRFRAIDETGPPIRHILDRLRQSQEIMRRVMGDTRRGYDEQGRAAESMGRRAEGAHRQAARAAQRHGSEIGSLVGRYASAAAAADLARRAVLGFASGDDAMRRVQNRLGLTRQQTADLEKEIRKLGLSTGHSFEDALGGIDEFSDRLNVSGQAAAVVGRSIGQAAKVAGIPFKEMGAIVGQLMNNLKIDPKDTTRALDTMTHASQTFGFNLGELMQRAPDLTQAMATWGYTGVDGLEKISAFIGVLEGKLGSAEKAVAALEQVFNSMGDESVANKFGMSQDNMLKILRASKDPLGTWISMIEKAQKRGLDWNELNRRSRGGLLALFESRYEMEDFFREMGRGQGATERGFKNLRAGAKETIGDLINSVKELGDSFGKLMVEGGGAKALSEAVDSLTHILDTLNLLQKWLDGNPLSWEKFLDTAGLADMWDRFTTEWERRFSAIDDMLAMRGKSAKTQALEDKVKRLDERIYGAPKVQGEGKQDRWTPGTSNRIGDAFSDLPLTKPERDAVETLRKFDSEIQKNTDSLKKMSFMLGDGGGPRIMQASYGGGPGGVGGARAYGGGPGGFGGGPGGVPYAGGGRFGGAGLGALGRGGGGSSGGPGGGGGGGPGGGGGSSGPGETPGRFANVRTNNPGAQAYSRRASELFGATPQTTGTGHSIANFPSPVHGAASNMDLFSRNYTGMRLGDALRKWSGGGCSAPKGYDPNMIVTPEMMRDPNFAIPLMKSIASGEAPGKYPMDDPQWAQAHQWAMEGGAKGRTALGRSAPSGAPFAGGARVEQAQAQVAGTRRGAIDPRLEEALNAAAEKTGLNVRVTSGGQRMPGAPGATGSHRHDQGRAADFDLLDERGNKLAINDPRRVQFLEEMAAAGAGGAGMGYMSDPHKIHGGITGSAGRVGEGLGAYAGSRAEREAIARGVDRMHRDRPIWERSPEERAIARGRVSQTIPQADAGAPRTLQGYGHPGQGDTWGRGAQPAPYMGEGGGALGSFGRGGAPEQAGGPSPFERSSAVDDAMRARQELERPIKVNMDMGGATQFGRASMRREADREVREARFSSTSDIGAA